MLSCDLQTPASIAVGRADHFAGDKYSSIKIIVTIILNRFEHILYTETGENAAMVVVQAKSDDRSVGRMARKTSQ